MNWFIVKMIFQIETEDNLYPQFDEQLRIIDAINEDLALEIAYQMGQMEQEEIKSHKDEVLKWKFIAVTEINNIGDIAHGKEIHYQITEPEEAANYLSFVKEKALSLKNRKQNLNRG
jgi:hypothetical protein